MDQNPHTPVDENDPDEVVTGAVGIVTETLPPPALDPDDDPDDDQDDEEDAQ